MFVYGHDAASTVALLTAMGLSKKQISRCTGISRSTIRAWLHHGPPGIGPTTLSGNKRRRRATVTREALIGQMQKPAYAYLLGLYLGDGHIAHQRRGVFQLRIFLDSRYPGIVNEAGGAMAAVLPRNKATPIKHPHHNLVTVVCSSKSWPTLFPQHGPGRKHERTIKLEGWQLAITWHHPEPLIRGLIHSDGCRFVANQPGRTTIYRYPRYCFKNTSRGIMGIFCDHLDLLGVRWTMTAPDQAQIARRDSVALLDSFVGPKA